MVTENGTSLTVSWNAVSDPMYNILYVVRYSTNSGNQTDPPSNAMKRSGIADTSTTLTGLQSDTIYYVWVAAEILGAGVQGPYSRRALSGGDVTVHRIECALRILLCVHVILLQNFLSLSEQQLQIIYGSFKKPKMYSLLIFRVITCNIFNMVAIFFVTSLLTYIEDKLTLLIYPQFMSL